MHDAEVSPVGVDYGTVDHESQRVHIGDLLLCRSKGGPDDLHVVRAVEDQRHTSLRRNLPESPRSTHEFVGGKHGVGVVKEAHGQTLSCVLRGICGWAF